MKSGQSANQMLAARQNQQNTIAYSHDRESSLVNTSAPTGSHSLVAENRNRNLIVNSLNRPPAQFESMSVGLSSAFVKKVGQSQVVSAHKGNRLEEKHSSITKDINPLEALNND